MTTFYKIAGALVAIMAGLDGYHYWILTFPSGILDLLKNGSVLIFLVCVAYLLWRHGE